MKLKTINFTLVTLIMSFVISSVYAETVQLDFQAPLQINCKDNPNGVSCIELDPQVPEQTKGRASLAADFQAQGDLQETNSAVPKNALLVDEDWTAQCVSVGGSTAATGNAGGFCLASDLSTLSTEFASFSVANDLPVTGIQFLQVTLRDGSQLVGSRDIPDTDAPIGAVCVSVGGSTAAAIGSAGGFCLAVDLTSDIPAAFAVANGLPVAGLQFLQVTFGDSSQLGGPRGSPDADTPKRAECLSTNGSTAATGDAGGFCLASDLSASTMGVANLSVANDLPVAGMHFLQVTFGDGGTFDVFRPGADAPMGAECVSQGGSAAVTGDAGLSCLASDLSASTTGEANLSVANDLPIASMQFLQALFGDGSQPRGSRGIGGLDGECVSVEGSTATTGNTEGFCLVSDRSTSTTGFANFSVANALPVSALHFLQVPFRDDNQLDRSSFFLLGEGAPMGVVISDSVGARFLRRSLPAIAGVAGHDNRYFRISQRRSGIEIQSSPNQRRRFRPAFWTSR